MIRTALYLTLCLMAAKVGFSVLDSAQATMSKVNAQQAVMCAQANEVAPGSCKVPLPPSAGPVGQLSTKAPRGL